MAFVRYSNTPLSGTVHQVLQVYATQAEADGDTGLANSTARQGSVNDNVEPLNWYLDTSDGSITDLPQLPTASLISIWREEQYAQLKARVEEFSAPWGVLSLFDPDRAGNTLDGIRKVGAALSEDANYTNATIRGALELATRADWHHWHHGRQVSVWPDTYFADTDTTLAYPGDTNNKVDIPGAAMPSTGWPKWDISVLWE